MRGLIAWAVFVTAIYAIMLGISSFYAEMPGSHTAVPAAVCAEDSWCFNPLTQGNHLGTVPVFPAQPFHVIASYPQETT